MYTTCLYTPSISVCTRHPYLSIHAIYICLYTPHTTHLFNPMLIDTNMCVVYRQICVVYRQICVVYRQICVVYRQICVVYRQICVVYRQICVVYSHIQRTF